MPARYFIETLGCPKNQVDSEKIAGSLLAEGYVAAEGPEVADLVVVNTCAFIDAARAESVETILALEASRHPGARLVVTGCLAARSGSELAAAIPEIDLVADVGVPVTLRDRRVVADPARRSSLDLLELARPPAGAPWAYVKVAEGCDRACGFCAIPSFRGPQRSREEAAILAEVDALAVPEVVLVAQDLGSYGRDLGRPGALVGLVNTLAQTVERVRLLYLYPSALTDPLIEAICGTGVVYFDLSLQHTSRQLLRAMRRPGGADRFLERIAAIRRAAPDAAFRSSFIVGYPGEQEEDHDELLGFLAAARLDWAGFFPFSPEEGTAAAGLDKQVPRELALERLREAAALQDSITAARRAELVGTRASVLLDAPGVGRSHREAPEIDGVIRVPGALGVGTTVEVEIVASEGPDLVARPLEPSGAAR